MLKKTNLSAAEMIADAFMDLMLEKPYTDITVTDVVTRAGVARASFYRNYDSVSGILEAITERLAENFINTSLTVMEANDERAWRDLLFRWIYQFCDHYKKLAGSRFDNIPVLFSAMNRRIQKLESRRKYTGIEGKYRISARVGAVSNVLRVWMDGGMRETPEEIINYIMSFITLI